MKPIEIILFIFSWTCLAIIGMGVLENADKTNRLRLDLDKLDSIITQIEAQHALERNFEPYSLYLYATQEATKAGIDPERFADLINCESKWDWQAKNPNSSATGLLQFITSTWEATDSYKEGFSPYNPYASIREAVKMISEGKSNQWECVY